MLNAVANDKNMQVLIIEYTSFVLSLPLQTKTDIFMISLNSIFKVMAVNILIGSALVSCVDKDTDYSRPTEGQTPNDFTYSTTQQVQLNVQYDVPEGYQVLFGVYFENPLKIDEDGQVVERTDVSPKVMRMTDGTGKYSGTEVIPGYLEGDIYIYSSYIGVPSLYKTTLQANTIQADINWDTMYDMTAEPSTRAEKKYSIPAGFVTLGGWDAKGRPDYLDSEGELTLSASILNAINNTIPEGKICKPEYRQSADFELQEPAHVKVRFIGGTSSAQSTFGYYCYKAGADQAGIRKAKKNIVFPNTKTGIGIKGGECVELHYIDETGVDRGTAFPKGVRIGWFICNNFFKNGNINGKDNEMFYSTTALNSDKRTHTAAFKINDFVVLAFEDWTDQDYNDVMFNVWSDPIKAIVTPEVPDVTPPSEDDKSIAYSMTYKGILAFEDNWPSRGDYDLNDVVVKYNSVLCYNTKNEVISTEDEFTALWSGAIYHNSFAYQINTNRSNVESTQSMDQDLTLATFTVFTDAKEATNDNNKTTTLKISNTFKTPIDHEVFGVAPYNPFISIFKDAGYDRAEVHLINYKPTDKAKKSLFHTEEDLSDPDKGIYYVSASKYPFAINLSDAESYSTNENETVDTTYPKFNSWVESNGTKDKDWYLIK